ncbi:MAG TPA: exopolyphosphatase [Desulfobacteraceae bacterium]|nr:exopolyphosphatase [Desulfobacteraceae bacterium]
MNSLMDHPFPKSITSKEKCKRLLSVVDTEDTLGIFIDADPDAMASAVALKRIFWRKVRKAEIYHINAIQRADNLAFIKFLRIDQNHIRHMKPSKITKWAIVDSQPHHHEEFKDHPFDIIIDHHPTAPSSKAHFLDIKEDYGANSTIMTEYLRANRIRPAPRLATALFYGIKTDTDNFVRESLPNDINAFRYLYRFTNMNIIKKIESSEMTKKTLDSYRAAMDRLKIIRDIAFVHMGNIHNPDILVMIADFHMKLAEATWSIASGVYDEKLIVILRNAGFRGDAGKTALKLFGPLGGSAGGHKGAARAEVPLEGIMKQNKGRSDPGQFVQKVLKNLK